MMLGNFSVKDMEDNLGVNFPSELKELLSATRQENVSIEIKKGKWHCFHLPFSLVCGGKELAKKIYDFLKPLEKDMKKQMSIQIVNNKEATK